MESFTESEIVGVREEPRISGQLIFKLSLTFSPLRATIWQLSKWRGDVECEIREK